MQQLNLSLQEIQVDCAIVEWEGEPCLFVQRSDESATMCRLKNVGAAIAEPLSAPFPFLSSPLLQPHHLPVLLGGGLTEIPPPVSLFIPFSPLDDDLGGIADATCRSWR